jgi:hypothetical protein
MKYFIVGLHGSGKQEVVDILEHQGVACGKLFSNIEAPSDTIYGSYNYELVSTADINEVFENNAYVFLRELKHGTEKYYEGLSTYDAENNDVFVLSPDQLVSISPKLMPEGVCFIWLDNTKANRYNRYRDERCSYNFNERENLERQDLNTFIKNMYAYDKNHVLYFMNDDPVRIAAIVFALVQHEDLLPAFSQAFSS